VIKRIAAVIGVVTFLVLAGTTASLAYWSSQAATHTTVSASSLGTNCTNPVMLVNGGIELPVTTGGIENKATIPGWSIAPVSSNPTYEIWRNYDGATAAVGSQFLELNGNGPDTLYQEVSAAPGQVLTWSVLHRGRWGNDTMYVAIDPAGSSSYTYQIPTGASATAITTGTGTWKRYSGVYVVPASQAANVKTRFALVPGTTTQSNGSTSVTDRSVGNLVDDISFGSGPCLTSASTITKISGSSGSAFATGDVVEYTTTISNSGGAHADSSVFTTTLPSGLAYLANSLVVDSVSMSDSAGNDAGEVSSGVVTARLGFGATSSAGGAIPAAVLGTSTSSSTIAPAVATVRLRATIQPAASGNSVVFMTATSYRDAAAPTWPLTAASTISTPVVAQADLAVSLVSAAPLNASNRNADWVFRVTNNGPATSDANITVSTSRSPTSQADLTGRTIEYNAGAGWQSVGTAFSVASISAGGSVDVRIRGTVPASGVSTNTNYLATVAAATVGIGDPVSGNNSLTSTLKFDNVVPTRPTNLNATHSTASATQTNQITLTWTASSDTGGSGIAGYRIYRNAALIATTTGTGTGYTDNNASNDANGTPRLSAHTPYWYWVEAIDASGNVSTTSDGDGAVTFATGTDYRIAYPWSGTNDLCIGATANSGSGGLRTAACSPVGALNQWRFTAYAGDADSVYIQFTSSTARRWTVPSTNGSGTDLSLAAAGDTNARSRWQLGVYWDAPTSTAYVEIRRQNDDSLCLDVDGAAQTSGAIVQQWTCNQTAAQRFLLRQP
jgi:uncharacterized repeat protein (TIGR01451 family)